MKKKILILVLLSCINSYANDFNRCDDIAIEWASKKMANYYGLEIGGINKHAQLEFLGFKDGDKSYYTIYKVHFPSFRTYNVVLKTSIDSECSVVEKFSMGYDFIEKEQTDVSK